MIQVDKALIRKLTDAQVKYAAEMMLDDHWRCSDDGWDYCQAAVELAHIMLHIDYNDDVQRLTGMLNNTSESGYLESLGNFACDGICPEFYDLNSPSIGDNP